MSQDDVLERLRDTEDLLALAGELSGSLDRVELARRAAREVTKLLGADTTLIIRFDITRGTAVPMAGYHVPDGLRGASDTSYTVTAAGIDEAVLEAFRTGQPISCPDATVDRRFDHPFISFLPCRPGGLVVMPLLARGLPYGAVISYWWHRAHVLTERGLRIVAGVASHVSLALQNAELYADATKALADLEAAQEQLVRGETLRALGELAQGTAHHLNNLLTVILARVQMLRRADTTDSFRRPLALVERAASDAAEVVRRVQEFTRVRQEPGLRAVDMREVVVDVLEMTRSRWESGIEVVQNVVAVPPVRGDAVALREALSNLVLNAVDALPQGGTIVVSTCVEDDAVVVTVRDTGVGMSSTVRHRAIEPFFTTKDVRRTGLGLSTTYGIVSRHAGTLAIDSDEGHGTTVTMRLPVGDLTEEPAECVPLRVLVVDDEETMREALAMMLRRQGHAVACVPSGAAALELLHNGAVVNVVLTDLRMPAMTGWAVARSVKERWPDITVGLVTGWTEDLDVSGKELRDIDFIVRKPVDHRVLAEALERIPRRALAA